MLLIAIELAFWAMNAWAGAKTIRRMKKRRRQSTGRHTQQAGGTSDGAAFTAPVGVPRSRLVPSSPDARGACHADVQRHHHSACAGLNGVSPGIPPPTSAATPHKRQPRQLKLLLTLGAGGSQPRRRQMSGLGMVQARAGCGWWLIINNVPQLGGNILFTGAK
jgi:hypothetical protein